MLITDEIYAEICDTALKEVFASPWASVKPSDVDQQLSSCCYGSNDANWLAFFSFFREVVRVSDVRNVEGLEIVAQSCGWWWPFSEMVILTDRPMWIDLEENRLHSPDRKALMWSDGSGFYMWKGMQIPDWIIESPEKITADAIISESNVEIRRVMLEKAGFEVLLSKAKKLHQDDYGELYQLPMRDDEDVTMVRVVNSTAEPDGTYRNYILRVPPTTRTAREAVAWTLNMTSEEYDPAVQT